MTDTDLTIGLTREVLRLREELDQVKDFCERADSIIHCQSLVSFGGVTDVCDRCPACDWQDEWLEYKCSKPGGTTVSDGNTTAPTGYYAKPDDVAVGRRFRRADGEVVTVTKVCPAGRAGEYMVFDTDDGRVRLASPDCAHQNQPVLSATLAGPVEDDGLSEPPQAVFDDLDRLAQYAHGVADSKDWHAEDRTPLEYHALITSEVAEATEAVRDGLLDEDRTAQGKPVGEATEIADVVIRCLDYAQSRGWSLGDTVRRKLAYNRARPARHGGKLK